MSNHNPWALMGSVRGRIYLAMFCSGVSSLSLLLSMVFLAASLTSLMTSPNVWPWAPMLGALIATIATFCFRILSFDISHFAAFRLEAELRLKLSRRIAYLPLGKAQSIGSATLSKILTEDVRALHVFVADSTPLYARAFAMPLMTMVFLPLLDWRLALTALAILAFGFGVLAYAMRDFRPMFAQYHNAREQVSRAIVEFVQAMPTVRIFDEGHTTFGRFQTALEEYLEFITEWYRRSAFSARFSMAVMNMLPTLVALIVVGLWLQSSSQLELSCCLRPAQQRQCCR